jgi:tetratricopeptide (TPR) repeat protein
MSADLLRSRRRAGLVQALGFTLGILAAPLEAAGPPDARECVSAFYRGDYPKAVELARERLETQPGDVEARIILARSEAALGRFDAAYDSFREALRLEPRNPDALYYVGFTAGVLAQAEYERLFALAPESPRAHQLLGEAHQAQGRTKEAEAQYKAVLEKSPDSVEALVALGDITRKGLRFDEAFAYYSRATALAPRSFDAHYGVGACRTYQGKPVEAIESFRRALALEPGSAAARLALGISLLQTSQTEAAVTELEAATALEPQMRQAYYHLGRAYKMLGRSADADAAFAKVQELLRRELEAPGDELAKPER